MQHSHSHSYPLPEPLCIPLTFPQGPPDALNSLSMQCLASEEIKLMEWKGDLWGHDLH